ncbi:glycoside hydrolase family 172 protein [Saccharopolyspora sp. NPDC002686]|uniref:glycoside hydrolase family 172 protein n=1 Tax=Saccharopolyspora sp. NPDC002686 TaxID=3154541 RepID=UPI003319851B
MALAAAGVVANAGVGFGSGQLQAQPAAPTKGPVGWDTYRNLDSMSQSRGAEQSLQFSSYDRTGGNNDGFQGTYSCLRISDRGCVIGEHDGPGEITSIWSTREPLGDVTATGNIVIELDGRTVVDAPFIDVVRGKLGAPFVWPLVGDDNDTAGGVVIKVPMPYRKSMRVTVEHNPYFYHLSYRAFPDADGVQTFNPNEQATDVVEKLRQFGVADPKGSPSGTPVRRDFDLAPGAATPVADLSGAGQINQLRLKVPQVVAAPQVVDDGRAFGAAGRSRFTMRVAPNNDGIRVIRRYDPQIADQVGSLSVDGQQVGEWRSGGAAPGSWGVQVIEVPPTVTSGKSTVDVENKFISSSLDFNEFRYDVQSKVGGDWVRTDVLDLGPGHPGEEAAHGYRIDNPVFAREKLVGRYPTRPEDVAASDEVLDKMRLRISFDGQTTVDAPIGEFFGSGLGEYDVRNMMSSIDPGLDGWYTSWWPMPFGQNAKVELVNTGGVPVTGATAEVTSAPTAPVPGAGYFHATHHRGQTVPGQDWNFLTASGSGTFYGVTHSMRGLIPPGARTRSDQPLSDTRAGTRDVNTREVNQRNYLEGDERFFVDGNRDPAWHGTGTEDFYESGWYFRFGTTYSMPLAGNPSHEINGDGCQYDCTGAYRLFVNDAVPFRTGIVAGIEHGPVNDEPGDYGSTAYWYGGNASGRALPGLPPVPTQSPSSPAPSAPPSEAPTGPPSTPASPAPSATPARPSTPETTAPHTTGQNDGTRPSDVEQAVQDAVEEHQSNG